MGGVVSRQAALSRARLDLITPPTTNSEQPTCAEFDLPEQGAVKATKHCGRSRGAKANYTIATGQSRARNELPLSCPDAIAAKAIRER